MLIGLGIDLTEISRINKAYSRFGTTFIQKILHPEEQTILEQKNCSSTQAAVYLASRFAAKEAGVKALGTGFSNGIWFHDLLVRSLPSGQPQLYFLGAAHAAATALGVTRIHLSITHSKDTAGAVVVLESN